MFARLSVALLVLLAGSSPAAAEDKVAAEREEGDVDALAGFFGAAISRALSDCRRPDGIFPCLKARAVELLDRVERPEVLRLTEGLAVVRTSSSSSSEPPLAPVDARTTPDDELTRALADRVARFLAGHVFQVSFPRLDGEQLERSLEEGRGKMKKMMGHMMMMMGMKMMMFGVLGIAGLFLLAGKALIISKIALLLSGILALKKLVSQQHDQHHDHHEMVHGWASGGGGGGGWGRRAFHEQQAAAQRLAYRAHRPSANDV